MSCINMKTEKKLGLALILLLLFPEVDLDMKFFINVFLQGVTNNR